MSKKHQPPAGDLAARIQRTRAEGKYQQALDLVKQLHKAEPTPAHLELLKDTYLRRAEQLRAQNHLRDAATVVEVASRLDDRNPDWLGKLAAEMARCGEVTRALALANRLPEPARAAVFGPMADGAVQQGKAGRDALPPALQADCDRVVLAFQHAEAGRDDQAKAALDGVGLRSPFLEWKVFLRGMLAFYAGDDDRARDNWSRLAADRLPARLAAPFRASIDAAYRSAQSPQTQQALAQQFQSLQATPGVDPGRDLRPDFEDPQSVARAYRAAEQLYPALKLRSPKLADRLARCFYWSLKQSGPGEIPRYRRVFGSPPDDLDFHRLCALAFQESGSLDGAHDHWQKYEKEVASRAELWPGEQGTLARALIWLRMGEYASSIPTAKQMKKLGGLARMFEGPPPKLNPGPAECYARCIELAPTLLEAHQGLLRYYLLDEADAKAIGAAEALLASFPDHVETLDRLAGLYLKKDKPAEAVPLLQHATRHNPLDTDLRYRLHLAHSALARQLAAKSKFDQARPHFEAAIATSEPMHLCSGYCQWAACEVKAGDEARGAELLAKARAHSPGELLIDYNLLVEANRLKLSNTFKTKYTKAFNAGIAGPATPDLAVALVRFVYTLDSVGIDYYGRATHWKKVFDYAFRVRVAEYGEARLESLFGNLTELEPPKRATSQRLMEATSLYPENPFLLYYRMVDALGDDAAEMPAWRTWRFGPMIDEIEQLAAKRPSSPRLERMKADLKRRRAMLQAMNPFDGFFGRFRDVFGGGDDEDEEDDYEDEGRW